MQQYLSQNEQTEEKCQSQHTNAKYAMIIEKWVALGYCNEALLARMFNISHVVIARATSKYMPIPRVDGEMITLKSKV